VKVGDLVKSSKDTSLSASVGVVVEMRSIGDKALGARHKWVRVFYPSELGKRLRPPDGIFLIRKDHLKVISENR
jgi:hypothetical protein